MACCTPNCRAYAQVTMTCPPPILPPTRPQPVKPLQLPCMRPQPPPYAPFTSAEEREASRYDNYYNAYNIDWRRDSGCSPKGKNYSCSPEKQRGVTLIGTTPCCDDAPKVDSGPAPGCPTGFQPCAMKLTPPPNCDLCGVWTAEIQACPPKSTPKQCR